MALVQSIISGNFSASSLWDAGSLPADGDRIFNDGFDVVFDTDATIGESAASGQFPKSTDDGPSAALFSKGSCTVTIKANVTLRCKGDVLIHGGKLILEEGATLILDTTDNPDGVLGFYILDIAAEYGQDISQIKLIAQGVAGNPCEIRMDGDGLGWIDAGVSLSNGGTSKRGSGCCNCQYTIFRNLGSVPHKHTYSDWAASALTTGLNLHYYRLHAGICFDLRTETQNTLYTAQVEHVWHNCIFDNVVGIKSHYPGGNAASFKKVEFVDCRVKNTPWFLRGYAWLHIGILRAWSDVVDVREGVTYGAGYKHAAVEGTRIIRGNTFDREIKFLDAGASWEMEGNVFCDGLYVINTGTYKVPPFLLKKNFIVRSDQWTTANTEFPEFVMGPEWRATASPGLYGHYGCAPMEDYNSYKTDYMNYPYGSGFRDPDIPANLTDIKTWIAGNYFLEDSSRDNPHYVQPKYGDGNGIHVIKDNIFEGARVSGDGEFLRFSYFFNVARTTPTQDTACAIIVGNLCLPTASGTTGGSLNHIIETTYPSGHSLSGQNVLGPNFVENAELVTSGFYFGGYIPHMYTNNTLFLGTGEGAINCSENGYHYDVIRYCKNNIFWDTTKRSGNPVPWCVGDVSGRVHPDTVDPLNVDYNIKINASGNADTTLTGNSVADPTAGQGHNTSINYEGFNSNGYTGLELEDPDTLVSGVKRINAFGLNDIELIVQEADLPFINPDVNSGFYSFSKSGITSSTRTWRMVAKQKDYDDPQSSPDWTLAGLFAFVRGSSAPVYSVPGYNSPLENYKTLADPALAGGNPLGSAGHFSYAASHAFNETLVELASAYSGPGALPFSAPNTPPVANDDSFNVPMNGYLDMSYSQLLANDTDTDPEDTTLFVGSISGAVSGTVTVDSTARTVRYTPNTDFFGADFFTYLLQDSRGGTSTGTVQLTVVNQPPVAENKTVTGDSGAAIIIPKSFLLVGATDPEGTAISFSRLDQPANGGVTDGGSDLVYISDQKYHGVDQFTFYVADANGVEASAICTVAVNPGAGTVSVLTDEEKLMLQNALKVGDFLALK